MYLYLFFILSMFLFSILDILADALTSKGTYNNRITFFKFLAIISTISLLGFRFANGWDYMAYYYTIKNYMITNITARGEILNIWLVDLAKFLESPFFYFMSNAVIQILLVTSGIINKSKNFWLSFLLYITFPLFYLNSFSVVRMLTAVALIFFSNKFIEKNQPLRYCTSVFIASFFHQTAIFALIFYPLSKITLNRKIIISGLLFGFLSKPLMNIIVLKFFPEYNVYLKGTTVTEGTKAILIFLLIGIIIFLFLEKFTSNKYTTAFYIGLLLYIMFYGMGTISHRLSLYGTIFSLYLVSDIYIMITESLNNRFKILIYFILYLGFFMMFWYSLNVGSETYIPYNFYFKFDH